jgi:hypothetical protein
MGGISSSAIVGDARRCIIRRVSIGMSPSSDRRDDGTAIGIYLVFVSKLPILCAILVHALCDCT